MTRTTEKGPSSSGFPIPTITTYSEVQMPTLRSDRPALLVSSTSWTPDEDFSILLEALQVYDSRAQELFGENQPNGKGTKERLPKLLVILTGKGPLKDKYMKDVEKLQESWNWVRCISLWLEAKDYPILLGSADLGVCLHSSSSALDLPMKVVDMFGCGLPVCALGFACLHELVKNGKNGLIFQSASELASQLEELFLSFPDAPALASLTASLRSLPEGWSTWEENWGQVVRPLILSDVNL